MRGVVDTEDVKIVVKRGQSYSTTTYSVEEGLSDDGRVLSAPLNAAFEIKFPDLDIKGTIK